MYVFTLCVLSGLRSDCLTAPSGVFAVFSIIANSRLGDVFGVASKGVHSFRFGPLLNGLFSFFSFNLRSLKQNVRIWTNKMVLMRYIIKFLSDWLVHALRHCIKLLRMLSDASNDGWLTWGLGGGAHYFKQLATHLFFTMLKVRLTLELQCPPNARFVPTPYTQCVQIQ